MMTECLLALLDDNGVKWSLGGFYMQMDKISVCGTDVLIMVSAQSVYIHSKKLRIPMSGTTETTSVMRLPYSNMEDPAYNPKEMFDRVKDILEKELR